MKIILILAFYSILIHSSLNFSVDVLNLRNNLNHLRSKSFSFFLIVIHIYKFSFNFIFDSPKQTNNFGYS
jgi:hypothetical protein